ncbi:signal peptidase I [Agrococcus sp. SGAir0287]|uniref:signal peptidase I n=1 Tax=Agrococcus sp. SGAir0287 TaxID=2070347 RepID=UPI0010CCB3CC|nr:signal peptidase I [Agrococcus sp. SGAir0287]QCR20801.1 signal peptidase I [Agrococcus sp. SGAir0287]
MTAVAPPQHAEGARHGRAAEPTRTSPPVRRRVAALAGRLALDALALAGLACILLVVASFVFKVSIMLFATGSMSPTIPAGSIAVVREIPATYIAVGDVVTVDRDPELPITHRVVAIDAIDGDAVTFTMQGDANADADPYPYTETTVRIVVWSAPGLASAIVALRDPLVLGGITLGATALVTWAFWPRTRRVEPEAAHAAD